MKAQTLRPDGQDGFTLVELMVALLVAFLVIAAIYASYKVQQQNEKTQQQVTQIQQNLRAAMDMISREFRTAGYDPLYTSNYGITNASSTVLSFTADMCEDGGLPANCASQPPELYQYQLYTPGDVDQNDTFSLQRTVGGDAVAENIQLIEFVYIMNNGILNPSPPAAQHGNIAGIKVSLLGRADEPDYNYTDTKQYRTAINNVWGPFNDNYRRRLLIETFDFRNMGLL